MRKNNKEFQKKKNIVLFIYGYACQVCGIVDVNNHVHHINKIHSDNDPFNLIPLCPDCHRKAHKCFNFYFPYPSGREYLLLKELAMSF